MQIGGGLGEEYMHAPALQVGGGGGEKGGGGFIANLLDILGINRQVAKGPKEGAKTDSKAGGVSSSTKGKQVDARGGAPAYTPGLGGDTTSPIVAPAPPGLSVLDDAHAAFAPLTPQQSKLGFSSMPSSISPENLSRYGYKRY